MIDRLAYFNVQISLIVNESQEKRMPSWQPGINL